MQFSRCCAEEKNCSEGAETSAGSLELCSADGCRPAHLASVVRLHKSSQTSHSLSLVPQTCSFLFFYTLNLQQNGPEEVAVDSK